MKDTVAPQHSDTKALTISKVLAVFLSVSSAAVIVIGLLGYGVALSAEGRFNVPHATLFSSTLDLLTLGGWAVIQMLSPLEKLQQWSFYADFWEKYWSLAKPALGVVVVAMLVMLALGSVAFLISRLMGRWGRLKTRRAQLRNWLSTHRWTVKIVALPMMVLLGFIALFLAGWPLLIMAMIFCIALLGLVLSDVPLFGYSAGEEHIDDWVIAPPICAPVTSREVRLKGMQEKPAGADEKVRVASCVAIKMTDGKEYRGRVAFATSSAVILYDPVTGTAQRVPTEKASIEVVDKL